MTGRANTRRSELIVRQSWSQETNYARVSEVKLAADNISHKQTASVKSSLQLIFYIYFVVSSVKVPYTIVTMSHSVSLLMQRHNIR